MAFLLTNLAFGRASVTRGPVSHKKIKQLEIERKRFFELTCDIPKSGYTYGGEGSEHETIFPIGSSDVLYYVSEVDDENGDGKGSLKFSTSFSITKWNAVGRNYKKSWEVSFRAAEKGKRPAGTFLSMAFASGFLPITVGSDWTIAKKDLERVAPYAVYAFGQHGDVSLQNWAKVYDSQNQSLGMKPIEWLADRSARFSVLPAEIKLIRSSR